VAFAATLLYFWTQAKLLAASLRACGLPIREREALAVTFTSLLGNFLFPVAGLGFRAAVLHRRFGMCYGEFFATSLALTFFELAIFSAGGLGALVASVDLGCIESKALATGLAAVFASAVGALFLAPRLPSGLAFFRKLNAFFDDWRRLRRDRAFLFRAFGWTFVMLAANVVMFGAVYRSITAAAPLALTLLAAALSDISLLFRLAPGALGTFEAALLYANRQFTLPLDASVSAMIVVRTTLTATLLVFGSASFAWLSWQRAPTVSLKSSLRAL
jgi:uncharacterized membrane protein YbhN (UPF0104 family)